MPKFSIVGSILFGIPLVGAALAMGYQYFIADFTRELDSRELRMLSGQILRIDTISHSERRMHPTLQVWLPGCAHPIRFDEIRAGDALGRGKLIEVGIEASELTAPHFASVDNQHFYKPITARIVGGNSIMDLESHNSRLRRMRLWFPWLALALGAAGLLLSTRSAIDKLAHQRRPQLKGNRREPLKFRLLKP